MVWKRLVGKQFRKPWGPLGHLAARFMEKNNGDYYARVVKMLDVRGTDQILEIGCGTGLAMRLLLEQNAACRVWGLDFSLLMLKKAEKNNRGAIAQGRAYLLPGDFNTHDFGAQRFDKIYLINVIYFWETLGANFAKLRGLLAPGGRLVIFMNSPERLDQMSFTVKGVFNKRPAETVMAELQGVGFVRVEQELVLKKGLKTHYLSAFK